MRTPRITPLLVSRARIAFFFASLALAVPHPIAQQPATGSPHVFDYEVAARANFTKAAFRLWSPAYAQPIRAIVVLVPGYNGDGRKALAESAWQDFARSNRLALVACFMQGDYAVARSGSGDALEEALTTFAQQSSHPEIAHVPLLLYGASAGGQFNYNFVIWRPSRVMAFIVNKGGFYDDQEPDSNAYTTPGLFFLGMNDEGFRIQSITRIWTQGRRRGALWALAPQPESGHEFSRTAGVARVFFASVLKVRLPNENLISGDHSAMQPLQESKGWLGDLSTHDIRPANVELQPSRTASWLPDEVSAQEWKEFVVSGAPLPRPEAKQPSEN